MQGIQAGSLAMVISPCSETLQTQHSVGQGHFHEQDEAKPQVNGTA